MGHGHVEFEVAAPVRRALAAVAGLLAVLTVIGLVVLWPRDDPARGRDEIGVAGELYDAKVERVVSVPCTSPVTARDVECSTALVHLRQGPDRGEQVELDLAGGTSTPDVSVGDVIIVSHDPDAPDGSAYSFADHNRKAALWWLAALFAVVVVLLARLRGLAALGGLAASFLILLQFVLPAVVAGTDPLAVAVVGAAAIAFVALYLAHGFGPKTSVALLGTLGSLAVTVVLAKLFVGLAELSGFASEEATFLNVATTRIDLAGLVLGGIVIGALGAIDDMTVTQASVVAELREANPQIGPVRLFSAAMRVGRDHVASTVNTLALAYAGASMPLLVLFVLSEQSLGSIVNGEVIATELVRTLVGSIGLVAAVPLTTWLAVLVLGQSDPSAARWRSRKRRSAGLAVSSTARS